MYKYRVYCNSHAYALGIEVHDIMHVTVVTFARILFFSKAFYI